MISSNDIEMRILTNSAKLAVTIMKIKKGEYEIRTIYGHEYERRNRMAKSALKKQDTLVDELDGTGDENSLLDARIKLVELYEAERMMDSEYHSSNSAILRAKSEYNDACKDAARALWILLNALKIGGYNNDINEVISNLNIICNIMKTELSYTDESLNIVMNM